MNDTLKLMHKMMQTNENMRAVFGEHYESQAARCRVLISAAMKHHGLDTIPAAHQLIADLKQEYPDWQDNQGVLLTMSLIVSAAWDEISEEQPAAIRAAAEEARDER